MVLVLVLSACSAPAGLDPAKKDADTGETEEVEETEESEEETEDSEEETEESDLREDPENPDEGLDERPSGLALDDRIDIDLGSGDAKVSGTVKGKTESFKKDYDDIDALVFDAAEVFGVTLYEARYMTYVDGNRLLRPSELENVDEEVSELEDPDLDVSHIEFTETYEEGFIRGIGCDREEGILLLDVMQDDDEDHNLWRDVKPRIRNALVFRFNKKVLDTLHCVDDEGDAQDKLLSGEHYTCRKSNIEFVEDQLGTLGDIDRGDLKNEVVAGVPGRNEVLYFSCLNGVGEVASEDNSTVDLEDNSTNSTE